MNDKEVSHKCKVGSSLPGQCLFSSSTSWIYMEHFIGIAMIIISGTIILVVIAVVVTLMSAIIIVAVV